MTTRKKTTAELRRCSGSARFGIEPHEAPVSDFPKQPSRKDGLGTMCTEHWRAYVKALREARMADAPPSEKPPTKRTTRTKTASMRAATTTRRTRKASKPRANAARAAQAEALIAEVDALPADEHVKRTGDVDVQAALEASAVSNDVPSSPVAQRSEQGTL